jgi:hypothetical protein
VDELFGLDVVREGHVEKSMDREVVLLQQLRRGLVGWLDVIRRATGAKEVQVQLDNCEGVSIVAIWKSDGEERVHRKTFTREHIFGHTLELAPEARRLQYKSCALARQYIREILTLRGVIS